MTRSVRPSGVGHNLLLLTIDSLRADHVGCYGYARETTPRLDRLAHESAVFREAVSHGGGTPEAFPAILAGADPPLQPDQFYRGMAGRPTLAQVLRRQGYHTAAFHSNPFLSRAFHYAEGFETFDDGMEPSGPVRNRRMLEGGSILGRLAYRVAVITGGPPIVRAPELAAAGVPWLGREPFFVWLHFMDTHLPYMPSAAYLRRFGPQVSRARQLALHYQLRKRRAFAAGPRQALCNLYDACVRTVDDAIGTVLDAASGILNRTVVAVLADHGDGFGEHGEYGHYLSLYEELVRVPLIIHGPGVACGEVTHAAALGDVPATLLRLLGAGVGDLPGGDLFSARTAPIFSVSLDPRSRRRSIACRSDGWKYLRLERLGGAVERVELYHLRDDPGERRDLSTEAPDRLRRLEAEVEAFLRTDQGRGRETDRIRDRVKALRGTQRL